MKQVMLQEQSICSCPIWDKGSNSNNSSFPIKKPCHKLELLQIKDFFDPYIPTFPIGQMGPQHHYPLYYI